MSLVSGILNIREISAITGVSVTDLGLLELSGELPRPIRNRYGFKGKIWRASDIMRWARENRVIGKRYLSNEEYATFIEETELERERHKTARR